MNIDLSYLKQLLCYLLSERKAIHIILNEQFSIKFHYINLNIILTDFPININKISIRQLRGYLMIIPTLFTAEE